MRNRLKIWLSGDVPRTVGVYTGEAGVCLLALSGDSTPLCVFQAPIPDADQSPLALAVYKLQTMCSPDERNMTLAVAIDADEVFVRSLSVPGGLSDSQVEQTAIIEAVANLPVPPEEICLDFIRSEVAMDAGSETIDLAFCRRERIDEILAAAEGIPVPVSVVDRDIQALHDATVDRLVGSDPTAQVVYPFAILAAQKSRLIICLDQRSFEIYPLRLPAKEQNVSPEDLHQQIEACWNRSRMLRNDAQGTLQQVVCIDLPALQTSDIDTLPLIPLPAIDTESWMMAGEMVPPDEVLLIAAGMARRQC